MPELYAQLSSPAWWIAVILGGLVTNVVWQVLTWASPWAARAAVPVAQGLLILYAVAGVIAFAYCSVRLLPGWTITAIQDNFILDRIVASLVFSTMTVSFTWIIVFFGSPTIQLVGASVISFYAAFITKNFLDAPAHIPLDALLWATAWVYGVGLIGIVALLSSVALVVIRVQQSRQT